MGLCVQLLLHTNGFFCLQQLAWDLQMPYLGLALWPRPGKVSPWVEWLESEIFYGSSSPLLDRQGWHTRIPGLWSEWLHLIRLCLLTWIAFVLTVTPNTAELHASPSHARDQIRQRLTAGSAVALVLF